MATYKKGWTPEEKKVIDTGKKTLKSVLQTIKLSLLPFDLNEDLFMDFKKTFLYRFIINFFGGLLIIGCLLLTLYLGAVFVTWSIPKGNSEPMDEGGKMFIRLIFLGYLFLVFFLSLEED
jgi:hypothetical protein